MRTFSTQQELLDCLLSLSENYESVLFQSGHFAISFNNEKNTVEPVINRFFVQNQHNDFSLLTYRIVCLFKEMSDDKKCSLITLVNDWQYLDESANKAHFYEQHNFKSIFGSLCNQEISHLSPKDLGWETATSGYFFSEKALRKKFRKRIVRFAKQNHTHLRVITESDNSKCISTDIDGRAVELFSDKRMSSCTHEVAELVLQVKEQASFDLFINIYPIICRNHVELGTEIAFSLDREKNLAVINVGLLVNDEAGAPRNGFNGVIYKHD